MIEPKSTEIGRRVVYYDKDRNARYGTIYSFNNHYVFVLFKGEYTSEAIKRTDLFWSSIKGDLNYGN